ncbi:thioesterase [Nocardia panacis]|uniref:Thioesterase TesA n=1 Tax=Nocardia panacis TaxID=2340916 RepID=A0A3A4KGJ6_9NOCA|nr:alpha/beta fold hydrolase [Nocardia panacis]RJO67967.1 thioesterase [Nocardia panacis]
MSGFVESSLWIRSYNPSSDPNARLVCFPHAGGSASFFLPVSKSLAPTYEVLAIQYPGRQDRRLESPIGSINEIADSVAIRLTSFVDRPLALFGHSMGALIAYEVALRLQGNGTNPVVLFVSGRRAPSRYRDEQVHLLDDSDLLAEVARMEGTDQRLLDDFDLMSSLLPTIRSDYRAVAAYRHDPGARLTAPVYAHFGVDDPHISIDEAEDWRIHTSGTFKLHSYTGGHFYLIKEGGKLTDSMRQVLTDLTSNRVGG